MSYQRKTTLGRYGAQLAAPTVTSYTFPASVGGINAVSSLMMMPPEDAIYAYNLMPSEYGMRLRKGYRQWAINCVIDPAQNNDVKTILPYESNTQNLSDNRLFAVTSEGIWDVSSEGNLNPGLVTDSAVWTENGDPAGFGVSCEYTNDANDHYMFYADGLNGIWQYEQNASTDWVRPTGWTYELNDAQVPFPLQDVVFVMVFKQRIWVILEDNTDGWYLPVASVSGELKKFTFGAKMPHGGNLQGLYNWTLDSGIGVDDMLVAVSRGGDVIIYQGEDPEITPTGGTPWGARGLWFIGETPASRRIAVDYGPDLYLLSTYGLVSLNSLLRGELITGKSPSQKISRFLRADVESGKSSYAWQLVVNPSDGFLQIITPITSSNIYFQYNMNTQTNAWGFWEGVPILGSNSFSGEYYMGGKDGVVYIYDGALDGTETAGFNEFEDDSVPPIGVGWTVPSVLEFQCDGTQTAETEYKVNLINLLTVGTEYTLTYFIKKNVSISLWTNLRLLPFENGWTYTNVPKSWRCDGSQTVETKYRVELSSPLKAGVSYLISFSAFFATGQYKMIAGAEDVIDWTAINGIITVNFTPSSDITEMGLVGNSDLICIFSEINVNISGSIGDHSVSIGTELMASPSSGIGTYVHTFISTAANAEMALVGNEDFQGTFYNVSLRKKAAVGTAIDFRCLTSFQAPVGHSNFSRVGFIRTIGLVSGSSSINVEAIYDYNVTQYVDNANTVSASTGGATWDNAFFDTASWDSRLAGKSFTEGAAGLGRSFGVGMSGSSNTRINVLGWDVLFNSGGYL